MDTMHSNETSVTTATNLFRVVPFLVFNSRVFGMLRTFSCKTFPLITTNSCDIRRNVEYYISCSILGLDDNLNLDLDTYDSKLGLDD